MCRLLGSVFFTCWHVKSIAWCLISACAFFIYLCPAVCGLQRPRWHPVPARWICRPGVRPGGLRFLGGGCGGSDGHALAQGGPQRTAPSSLPPCGLQSRRDQTFGATWSPPHQWTHTFGRSGIGCWVCAGMRGDFWRLYVFYLKVSLWCVIFFKQTNSMYGSVMNRDH